MKSKVFHRAAHVLSVLALAAGTVALAQTADHIEFRGVINDYTPASTGGPWEVRGHWSLSVRGRYGRGDCKAEFSAALTMERSDQGVIQHGGGDFDDPMDRMAHTHHIAFTCDEVTVIPGGIQVKGWAVVTANGMFPPPFGPDLSPLTIQITGGTGEKSVPFSNITLTFGNPAATHFGQNPLHGVVVRTAEKGDPDRR